MEQSRELPIYNREHEPQENRFAADLLNYTKDICQFENAKSAEEKREFFLKMYPEAKKLYNLLTDASEYFKKIDLETEKTPDEIADIYKACELVEQAAYILERYSVAPDSIKSLEEILNKTRSEAAEKMAILLSENPNEVHFANQEEKSFYKRCLALPEEKQELCKNAAVESGHVTKKNGTKKQQLAEKARNVLLGASTHNKKARAAKQVTWCIKDRGEIVRNLYGRFTDQDRAILYAKYDKTTDRVSELLQIAKVFFERHVVHFCRSQGIEQASFFDFYGLFKQESSANNEENKEIQQFSNIAEALFFIENTMNIDLHGIQFLYNAPINGSASPMSLPPGEKKTDGLVLMNRDPNKPLAFGDPSFITLLHEIGHAIHQKKSANNKKVKFFLRDVTNESTEAIAFLFQEFAMHTPSKNEELSPEQFSRFALSYVYSLWENILFTKKPASLQETQALWNALLQECGLLVEENKSRQEWFVSPVLASLPFGHIEYINAFFKLSELKQTALPLAQGMNYAPVIEKLDPYLMAGYGDTDDLLKKIA